MGEKNHSESFINDRGEIIRKDFALKPLTLEQEEAKRVFDKKQIELQETQDAAPDGVAHRTEEEEAKSLSRRLVLRESMMKKSSEKPESKLTVESFPIYEGGVKTGVREETRDEKGITEEVWRDREGTETNRTVYIKDGDENIIKEEWYKDGKPEGFYDHEYDKDGKYLGKRWHEINE
jgi:hypothetical protein